MVDTPTAQEAVAQAETALKAKEAEKATPAPVATVASAAAAIAAAEVEAPPAQRETLEAWCQTKSKKLRAVELVGAFFAMEKKKGHLLDTSANFEAAFEAFRKQPA